MKLLFNLDYQTSFGEQLVMNIIVDDNQTEVHTMSTSDGLHWTAEISCSEKGCFDYYYSVCRGNKVMRHEWLVEPHRLELTSVKGTCYRVFDHWIDIP